VLCLVVGASILLSCSSDGGGVRPSRDAQRDRPGDAAEVVRDYLDALRTGDVEDALKYQCSTVADLPVPIDMARHQIDRLAGITGAIDSVEVRELDIDPHDEGPLPDFPDPVLVGYRLVIGGESHPEMQALSVVENGRRRWCGGHTPTSDQFFSEHRDERVIAQPRSAAGALRELMPSAGPSGQALEPDEQRVPTDVFREPLAGQMEGWSRGWARPGIGGSRVSGIRFATEQQAVDAARFALRVKFSHGVETFSIDGVPGAVGIRVLELGWLDVQPPDVGPYADWVYVVYGDTVVEITASELLGDPQHATVAALVRQVHSSAAITPRAPDAGASD